MRDNEMAAGGLIALFFVFLLAAILFIVTSYGIDRLTLLSAKVLTTSASQLRFDAFNAQLIMFRLEPVILLIGAGINYWINQSRHISGIVDLGGLLLSAAEMIVGTFIVMMLTLFGGGALDAVVGVLEVWNFMPLEDSFMIIQYLQPVFLGFMTLLVVGCIALFVVKCFQIVDYSSSTNYLG